MQWHHLWQERHKVRKIVIEWLCEIGILDFPVSTPSGYGSSSLPCTSAMMTAPSRPRLTPSGYGSSSLLGRSAMTTAQSRPRSLAMGSGNCSDDLAALEAQLAQGQAQLLE